MTRQIRVGDVAIGGGAPVVIQSMLNTKTTDVEGSLAQIRALKTAGCQIARLSVQNREAARGFAEICEESQLPLVADIHFDYQLAILAAEILIPGCIRYTKVYARITGSTDYQRARCWALSVFAPAFIYATNPPIIDDTCPGKRPDKDFYDELKMCSINVALHALGLQEVSDRPAAETPAKNKTN